MLPPDPKEADPDDRTMFPPVDPEVPLPTVMYIDPPFPLFERPVPICISPELPIEAVPVLKTI